MVPTWWNSALADAIRELKSRCRTAVEELGYDYDEQVKRVLKNAVVWAQPEGSRWIDSCPNVPADQAPNPVEIKGESLHKPGEEGFK